MAEREPEKHVSVETLAALLEGRLSEEETKSARDHLARCARCRLEMKRLERWSGIDSDEELSRRAEWLYARGKLERAYKERIVPAFVRPARPHAGMRLHLRRPQLLVPVAAAAVIALIIVVQLVSPERREAPQTPPARDVMRGAPPVSYGIVLGAPSGDIEGFPKTFSWASDRENEIYTLEIFAPSLERVYRADGIRGDSFAAPDTLRRLLKPNIIYLWNVKGRRGLGQTALSPNGWFRYEP